MRSLLIAIAICVVSAAAEGLLAGKGVAAFLRSLHQPRWALPLWGWYLIGVVYYLACLVALYRLLELRSGESLLSLPMVLLVLMMAANAGWNFIFFARKNFALSFAFFLPYCLLVAALLWLVFPLDEVATLALGAYAVYLPYALAWTYRIWRLNPAEPNAKGQ